MSDTLKIYGALSIAGQQISEAAGRWYTARTLASFFAEHPQTYGRVACAATADGVLEQVEFQARKVLHIIAQHRAANAPADPELAHTATAAACLEE